MAFILREVAVSNASTAFREGNSIFLNAFPHTNKDFVYCTDIKDFFPSIHIKRVVGLFKEMGYSSTVAYYLAKCTTYKESLPQGAPTSPDIANIICRRLDSRLLSLSTKNRWNYTRYCDNITISGNGNFTGNSIVQKIVAEEGFILNHKKTYISRRNCHQGITGLVANEKVNIPRHRRKNIRAMFHQAWLNPEKSRGKVAELTGHLGFLKMIRPSDPAITKYKEIIASLSSPGPTLAPPLPPR